MQGALTAACNAACMWLSSSVTSCSVSPASSGGFASRIKYRLQRQVSKSVNFSRCGDTRSVTICPSSSGRTRCGVSTGNGWVIWWRYISVLDCAPCTDVSTSRTFSHRSPCCYAVLLCNDSDITAKIFKTFDSRDPELVFRKCPLGCCKVGDCATLCIIYDCHNRIAALLFV